VKILVLNSGSSSIKFQLIETSPEMAAAGEDRLLAKGQVEKIGSAESVISCEGAGRPTQKFTRNVPDHMSAVQVCFECLGDGAGIDAVGHRIVHGGEHFKESAIVNDEVLRHVEECYELAPLHNPAHVKGYRAAKALLPDAPHVFVFDTAFHQSLPREAYLYGVPYDLYERLRVRRYGFHGVSYRYVSWRYAQIARAPLEKLKLIICHLGNGCSVCAIDGGRSVETSMGFTPTEGLVMGTRPGDLDPGVISYLLKSGEVKPADLEDFLNRRSGVLGLSGASNDLRDITARAESGNERAAMAIEVFCHRVKKYVAAYYGILNGADAIIFTGGIGEHRDNVRALVCGSLDAMGVALDPARNADGSGKECCISSPGARTAVWVIPTNEELVIARDTMRCILEKQ
jgi:acetate kinase